MNEDELRALANYLAGGGSPDLNALENLFNSSGSLLLQAGIGVPGIDAEYISDFVLDKMYEPYKGADPVALQENANEALRRIGEAMGISPSDMDALVAMVDGGTPAATATAMLLPDVYSSGFIADDQKAYLDALENVLEAHATAAELEGTIYTDPDSGDRYTLRPADEVQQEMENVGLKGQFSDPAMWMPVANQDRLDRSAEAASQASSERQQLAALEGLLGQYGNARRVPVVGGSPLYQDPTVTAGLLKFFEDRQNADREMYQQMRDQGMEVGSGTSYIDLAGAAGGSDPTVYQPLSEASSPALSSSSRLADQQEQAIKAANRYATFAAADQAQKKAEPGAANVRAQIQELAGAVPLPWGGVQTRQDSLDAVALSNAIQAQEEAVIPGAKAVEDFRNFVASFVPGGGGSSAPPKIKLTRDQILRTVDAVTSPLRRRV